MHILENGLYLHTQAICRKSTTTYTDKTWTHQHMQIAIANTRVHVSQSV